MAEQESLKSKKALKNKYTCQIAVLIFVVIILAAGIYLGFGMPSITGQVTLNEQEFNMLTPFGFNFGMLIIGVIGVIYVILLISKEGVER